MEQALRGRVTSLAWRDLPFLTNWKEDRLRTMAVSGEDRRGPRNSKMLDKPTNQIEASRTQTTITPDSMTTMEDHAVLGKVEARPK